MPAARFAGEFRAQRFQPDAYPRWLHQTDQTPACQGADPEIFFPEKGPTASAPARAICDRCPLLARCRSWALDQPTADLHGVWGGMTQYEREAYHRRLRAAQRAQEAA
ncbi:WhiB family transcriptional regulator [Micromonospora sp. WMMD1102]|uniref:WhiB family transcriptional regulator n=1 Tax=Micromonospora sp. WMMD1102 TaxID=3016105 RepID=UPI002414E4CE|nr:WhiB family transcriptional regulator [Micromonospora sp. WMMD1102]MDG4784333.1 WhiB family transcriptional regulator [Micromonospora sp. WMMD1102]MDG4784406.1 WhiB family transcriptional regulator [Micromonospora sp. WMMD1102]MDG4791910.1 WhiB family transcriptional regulator [Micromonospora sp. WMMD1102]